MNISERLAQIQADSAATRATVEGIQRQLDGGAKLFDSTDRRVRRLERQVYSIWVIGPVLIGAATILRFLAWSK